jgi:hypothetical protein
MGFVTLPFFIVTWPIVWVVADREEAAIWPLRCNTWEMETHRTSVITLTSDSTEDGACRISVDVRSPARAAQRDSEEVLRALQTKYGSGGRDAGGTTHEVAR